MSQAGLKKILEHPDVDELISKMLINTPTSEIHEWLESKYSNLSEAKYVISDKALSNFKNNYLDIYNHIKKDIVATTTNKSLSLSEQAELSVRNNKTYKSKMLELVDGEIDIKKIILNMVVGIETRAAQVFDQIQNDPQNTRTDRILIEWFDTLGNALEKYHKLVLGAPDQVIQHNVNIQAVDKYTDVFVDSIKETLSEMGIEYSLRFMELYNEKLTKLKQSSETQQSTEMRLAEAKIINETITEKLSND